MFWSFWICCFSLVLMCLQFVFRCLDVRRELKLLRCCFLESCWIFCMFLECLGIGLEVSPFIPIRLFFSSLYVFDIFWQTLDSLEGFGSALWMIVSCLMLSVFFFRGLVAISLAACFTFPQWLGCSFTCPHFLGCSGCVHNFFSQSSELSLVLFCVSAGG